MAFIPEKRRIATFPIAVSVYGDNGKKIEIKFTAQYHRRKKSELDDLVDGLANRGRIARGEEPIRREDGTVPEWDDVTDTEFLARHMAGWSGIKDADGSNLAFSADALRELVEDYPELAQPLIAGFWSAHRGVVEKN